MKIPAKTLITEKTPVAFHTNLCSYVSQSISSTNKTGFDNLLQRKATCLVQLLILMDTVVHVITAFKDILNCANKCTKGRSGRK